MSSDQVTDSPRLRLRLALPRHTLGGGLRPPSETSPRNSGADSLRLASGGGRPAASPAHAGARTAAKPTHPYPSNNHTDDNRSSSLHPSTSSITAHTGP